MNIKRINIERWMTIPKEVQLNTSFGNLHAKIEPIINKNGIYLNGKECWFEIDGLAYKYPIEMFKYNFDIIKVRELSNKQADALYAIVKAGLATKEQKEMAKLYRLYGKEYTLAMLRTRNRFKAFRNNIKNNNGIQNDIFVK